MRNRCCRLLGVGLSLLSACTSPTEPGVSPIPPGTHQSALTAVSGPGEGGTSVTPVAHSAGYFAGTMRFRVRGGKPNTTYKVMRAADFGKAGSDDGVCQRGEGAAPWSPADGPPYVQFPIPYVGPPLVIQTDSRGDGSLDYNYESPQIPRGSRFDVRMRLVDDESAPTTDLRSGCMTIEVL